MDNILILGAGYAGMMTATQLDKMGEPFTLVSRNPYHYLTTLLHEAAGGRSNPDDYTVPIKQLLQKTTSNIVVDEVLDLDPTNHTVRIGSGTLDYKWLVFALGWVPEYFGISGLAENSLVLTNLDSAIQIRQHIEGEFESYTHDADPVHLSIAIGGAGLTGIELMGEILDWVPELCLQYNIDKSLVVVQNIEAMPSILPTVSEPLRTAAWNTLEDKGGTLRTNTKVLKVDPGIVHIDGNDEIHAGTIIWTGGVRANPLLQKAGFTVDRKGRAKVNQYLQSVDHEDIFIGGDSAWFEQEEGKPMPPTAQAATQMGPVLAHNVSAALHGREMQAAHVHLQGTLASLGRQVGVGDVGGIAVKGLAAGLIKEATKVKYLWQLGGVRLAAKKTGDVVHI